MITAQSIGFLNTPALWEKEQFSTPQFEFPQLDMLKFQPTAIPSKLRLGHQIEHIFKQLIGFSHNYEVVLHNLPIRRNKITLGEIDFILKDQTRNKLIHVELTYKFYIIDPAIEEPIHQLIGPNRRDSFFDKMEKIKHRQFPLLHTTEGIQALSDRNIDHTEIQHQCCFKAQLFYPYESRPADIGDFNKDCLAGYWLRMVDFDKPTFAAAQYYIPTKSEWVMQPNGNAIWTSHTDTMVDINQSLLQQRAPMIWMKRSNAQFEKLFVVWW